MGGAEREADIYRHALCLYPYREDLSRGRYYPPVGLEIIARVLAPHCDEIDVVDLRHERGVATDFIKPHTDLVCISINWDRNRDFVLQQVMSIPPHILTVAGGRHATNSPEKWLRDCPNIDILVRGDGEDTMDEIASGIDIGSIDGVSFRRDGSIVHTRNRKYRKMEDGSYPDRHLRRYRYELDIEGAGIGVFVDAMAASRGCPFNCRFCSFNMNPWGEKRRYSARSPKSVVDELEEMDAQLVLFTDDVFTHDVEWVEEICELIMERGIRKKYVVNSRIEIGKRMDVVRKMERAGFKALLLGIESAHDKTLRSMRKGFDTAKVKEYFQTLRNTSMILHGYFILGCIGETEEDMMAIAPYARSLGLDTLGLSPLRCVPYDGLAGLVADTPGYHISPEGFVYSDDIPAARLRTIRRKIWRRFYNTRHKIELFWKAVRSGILTADLVLRLAGVGIHAAARRRRMQEAPAPRHYVPGAARSVMAAAGGK